MHYFDFYQIPISFKVDDQALRTVYYRNSKKYHPDFHTLADDAAQAEALEMATLNNEAYKTLSDPDRRMRYILELKGLLGTDEQQAALPAEFLMEMMEINELLMELEFDFEDSLYKKVQQALEDQESALQSQIAPILESYMEPGSPADLHVVKDYYLKKRYLLRIRENLSKFASH